MSHVIRFLKNLLKKALGQRGSACLNRLYAALVRLNPWNVVDIMMLRYHLARPLISKPTAKPLVLPVQTKAPERFESGKPGNVISRAKPHLLLLSEKWCEHNPNFGPSNDDHNFFGSLEASGLATYARLNHDEYCRSHRSFDRGVLLECVRHRPNLIVIVNWLLSPLRFETLTLIKERLRIPVFVVWGDSVNYNYMEEAESLLPYVDLNIVIDSSTAYLKVTGHPEKYLPMWTPEDPRIYYDPDLPRDIDVSFLGTMAGHTDRVAGIAALRSAGIDVYQAGGQREHRLPVEEYARVYMRSRIALNFCGYRSFPPQLKGRIFEAALCGAMLLETENPETARWFEPMVDYVPFRDERDLVEKAWYYLAHDSERLEIAARGHRKASEKYSGELFWKAIIAKSVEVNLERS